MLTREEIIEYALDFEGTYQDAPFHDDNWQLVRDRRTKKAFLWTYERNEKLNMNIKIRPEWRDFWREVYGDAVQPGYHQSKDKWTTIIIDERIPDDVIKRLIAESYDIVTYNPTKAIYDAVKKIPRGCVATYAQVAELAGNPRMCRAVGNALHKNPDPDEIPCYRVVNSKGELSGEFAFGGAGAQARLLEADGIEVHNGKVDLNIYKMKTINE